MKSSEMNICFYHPAFPGGGAERITLDIANYLSEHQDAGHSYRTYVVTTCLNGQYMSDDIASAVGIFVLPEDMRQFREELEELFEKYRFNVFVQVGGRPMPFVRQIADKYHAKVVHAHHNSPYLEKVRIIEEKRQRAARNIFTRLSWILYGRLKYVTFGKAERRAVRMYRSFYDYSDVFTVLCPGYRDTFRRMFSIHSGDGKLKVIYNHEYPVKDVNYDKDRTVLFVGRLTGFDKRVDRLLRIWKRVQDKLGDYDLEIVGDGPERDNLKRLSERLGLERVSFEGYHTDVSAYYWKASIICLVSSIEGWGLCLTEAQANGVIPVAFDCADGVREVLSPSGENGFLVPPFDEKAFARTLVDIAGLPETGRMRLRHNVVGKVMKYSPERILPQWKDLFDSLS